MRNELLPTSLGLSASYFCQRGVIPTLMYALVVGARATVTHKCNRYFGSHTFQDPIGVDEGPGLSLPPRGLADSERIVPICRAVKKATVSLSHSVSVDALNKTS
jgi:hypothetical protein